MKWGIVVEWDDRGLACQGWLQRTDEGTMDDPMGFDSEADAMYFLTTLPDIDLYGADNTGIPYDRLLQPREFSS
jgi:hypothetical protein